MAKDVTGVLKATAGYLKGKVEDGETPVGEELYNDIVQFFVKMLDLAGITADGTYDNETNGYQLIEALQQIIANDVSPGSWQNPSYNSGFSNGAVSFQYRLNNGKLEFRGDITATSGTGIAFNLPAAYRPANETRLRFVTNTSVSVFYVRTNGDVDSQQWDISANNIFNNTIIID